MGTKKSVIVEQHGGPLGAVIAGANVHDTKLLADTIDAIVIPRPDPDTLAQKKGMTTRPGRPPVPARDTPHTSAGSARRSSTPGARRPTPRDAG
jgi:hypothetical protein